MTTRLRSELETQIQYFIDFNCEDDDWPDAIVAPNIAARMAEAAYAVLMATAEGQEYAKQEGALVLP